MASRRALILGLMGWLLAAWLIPAGFPAGGPAAWRLPSGSPGPLPVRAAPVPEARAFWVHQEALTSPTSVEEVFRRADALGINLLFLQVYSGGRAVHDSGLLPRAPRLVPDYDPLAHALSLGRELDIEVHAWFSLLEAGALGEVPEDPQHVLVREPDWVLVDQEGRSLWDYGVRETSFDLPGLMLDPGLPEVADFALEVALEVVRAYGVDGLHLDLVRYPARSFGFHAEVRADFADAFGHDPRYLVADPWDARQQLGEERFRQLTAAWDDWRRERVTDMVRRIHASLAAEYPWVTLSAAVYPDAEDAREERLQDWPAWLAEGILDVAAPKAYSPSTLVVAYQIQEAVDFSAGRHVYAGLGAYLLTDNAPRLVEKIDTVRAAGAHGVVLFSWQRLAPKEAFLRDVAAEAFAEPAVVPPRPWKPGRPAEEDPDQG